MNPLATTKMSSKGQVVIPESIRDQLNLTPGTQFIVLGETDTVILKSVQAPSLKEFSRLRTKARKQARKAGLKKANVREAVKKARKK